MNKPYLRTQDAASRLELAATTLEKYRVYGGGPKFLRLSPRRIVYHIDDLDEWARQRTFESTSGYAATA